MAFERESSQILMDAYMSMRGKGISAENYLATRSLLVAPGVTMQNYIKSRIEAGDIVWATVKDRRVLVENRQR